MLEEFILDLLHNRKRYFRCLVAFIGAILLVEYGFVKTLFIFIIAFFGYLSGAPELVKTLKRLYKD